MRTIVPAMTLLTALLAFPSSPAPAEKSKADRCREGCQEALRYCMQACDQMEDPKAAKECREKGCKTFIEDCMKGCEKKKVD